MTEKPEKKENNPRLFERCLCVVCLLCAILVLIFIGAMAWKGVFHEQHFSVNIGGPAPAWLYEKYADKLEKSLETYQQNLTSSQSYLMIWGAVLAIVFLIFSVLGLYKIDEKLHEAKEKGKEILREQKQNQETFWETLLAVMSADKVIPGGEVGAFHASSYQAISNSLPVSVDANLKAYIKMERGHALQNENQFDLAINEYTEAMASLGESSSAVIKTILHLRRGCAYGQRSLRNRAEVNRGDLKSAIHDLDEALVSAWDNRTRSFICRQKGDFYLKHKMYLEAEKCASEIETYYVGNGSADDLRGDIYRRRWEECIFKNDKYFETAKFAYEKALDIRRRTNQNGYKTTLRKYIRLLSEKSYRTHIAS